MSDPFSVLESWLPDNDEPERPLMTLITATPDGQPDGRSVLLSEFDRDGFCFHTDSRSRKIAALERNPLVALVIPLLEERHQLTVQGVAEPLDAAANARVYARRSPYLRYLAWLNTDELAALPETDRIAAWADFVAHNPDPSPPPTWTGRRVRPTRMTFWTGRDDAPSRREEFTLRDGEWTVTVLAG